MVEQYAGYEQATLKKVIEARNTYNQAQTTDQKVEAADLTSLAFRGLAALGESQTLFLRHRPKWNVHCKSI